jgi:hypothetical protein
MTVAVVMESEDDPKELPGVGILDNTRSSLPTGQGSSQ